MRGSEQEKEELLQQQHAKKQMLMSAFFFLFFFLFWFWAGCDVCDASRPLLRCVRAASSPLSPSHFALCRQ